VWRHLTNTPGRSTKPAPKGPDVTYIENYQWVLRRKFVRATNEGKSDGTEDIIVAGYDPKTKGYRSGFLIERNLRADRGRHDR
jgi:hypothetical protein